VAIKEITDRISDVEFDLITARFEKSLPIKERIGNVNVYRIGIGIPILDKLTLPFWGMIKAIKLNNKNNYLVYWCMMVSFSSGAAYIANILGNRKVPIILTLQEGDSESYLKYRWLGLVRLSWWLALKKASVVTAISSYLADRAKKFGYYKKKVEIIPNGVDLELFGDIEFKKLGGPISYVHLITTSRLSKKNGVEDIIKALPHLSREQPLKFKLIIFGDGPLKKNLKKLVEKKNLTERVGFYDYKSHTDIIKTFKEFLNINWIFIRPSLSEGMGNSFIEAMAAGIPIIGTSVGGIVDFLKDGETGLFCKVNDPKSIADKIMEYVNNPDLTSKIIENAKKLVREKYDWDLIAVQMKNVFDNIK